VFPAIISYVLYSSSEGLFIPFTVTTVPCKVFQVATCWLIHLHSTGDLFGIRLKPPTILTEISMIFFSPLRNMTGF